MNPEPATKTKDSRTVVRPFAVVESCGRQYQLEAGRYFDIDLVKKEPGQEFVFDRVLMLVNGTESVLGQPHIEGARVTGKVLAHYLSRKIIVYKMRPKKRTRRKQGHRQSLSRIFIDRIELKDKVLACAPAAASTSGSVTAVSSKTAPPTEKKKKSSEPDSKSTQRKSTWGTGSK